MIDINELIKSNMESYNRERYTEKSVTYFITDYFTLFVNTTSKRISLRFKYMIDGYFENLIVLVYPEKIMIGYKSKETTLSVELLSQDLYDQDEFVNDHFGIEFSTYQEFLRIHNDFSKFLKRRI